MFLVIVLVVGGVSAYALNYVNGCKSGDGPHTDVQVTIPEGASGGDVVDILHEAGVLKCGGVIGKFLMRNDDRSNQIRSGEYTLQTNMTVGAALDVLTKKPPEVERAELPIPEGFRLAQIADRVQEVFGIPAKKFLKRAESGDYYLKPYLPKGTGTPEGFLFPATPAFSRHQDFLYVTNLALDIRLFGLAQAVDSQWTAQVKRYTISKIRARIPSSDRH